ncbi:MAG: hypothetical protein E6R09_06600 [Rhodocyclaceae bacterium]|nr:MAG: hypothetical protein E6R09_06600 [Rhodocyclaceae bacterium]
MFRLSVSKAMPGKGFCASVAAVALVMSVATPAMAGEGDSDVPPGSFIYQRDVGPRAAEDPGVPGKPSYVVLGGKDVIFSALGLQPLSDAEQAQVTAALDPRKNIVSDTVGAGLDILTSDRAGTQASLNGEHGGYVGDTISGAMSVVPAAMGALRTALGVDR